MTSKTLFNPKLMMNLDATQVGRIGEYLVAAVLSGYGYEVHHTSGTGYDLLVMLPNNAGTIRVDVKTKKAATGARLYSIRKGKTTTFREYEAGDCDIFALVCLEDMSVTFRKCESYDGKNSIYINSLVHQKTCPYTAWQSSISSDLPLTV